VGARALCIPVIFFIFGVEEMVVTVARVALNDATVFLHGPSRVDRNVRKGVPKVPVTFTSTSG
jgi:hypothetical protein